MKASQIIIYGTVSNHRVLRKDPNNKIISEPIFEPELALLVGLQVVSSKEGLGGGGRTF